MCSQAGSGTASGAIAGESRPIICIWLLCAILVPSIKELECWRLFPPASGTIGRMPSAAGTALQRGWPAYHPVDPTSNVRHSHAVRRNDAMPASAAWTRLAREDADGHRVDPNRRDRRGV